MDYLPLADWSQNTRGTGFYIYIVTRRPGLFGYEGTGRSTGRQTVGSVE